MESSKRQPIRFHDFHHDLDTFREEVVDGLSKLQKEIPAKFFYDKRGSELFDRICELEEYYLTRADISILEDYGPAVGELVGENALIIEYGSGGTRKIRILLDSLKRPSAYMPIDISKEHLLAHASDLAADHPNLDIIAVCADYMQLSKLPEYSNGAVSKEFIFFPGSTIGNLTRAQARNLLEHSAAILKPGDGMLVGVDLKKDAQILNAAYNDAQGVTAEFNLNLLVRINRELGADFAIDAFEHKAFYNEAEGRIEMHLVSLKNQDANIGGSRISFKEGETIHTESSYKYGVGEFQALARQSGFEPACYWTDSERLFAEHYLTKKF